MNEEGIRKLLKKLYFTLSIEEIDLLIKEFKVLENYLKTLDTFVNEQNIEPLVFPLEMEINYLREDVPEKPLKQDEVLKNVSSKEAGQIKVGKVL